MLSIQTLQKCNDLHWFSLNVNGIRFWYSIQLFHYQHFYSTIKIISKNNYSIVVKLLNVLKCKLYCFSSHKMNKSWIKLSFLQVWSINQQTQLHCNIVVCISICWNINFVELSLTINNFICILHHLWNLETWENLHNAVVLKSKTKNSNHASWHWIAKRPTFYLFSSLC